MSFFIDPAKWGQTRVSVNHSVVSSGRRRLRALRVHDAPHGSNKAIPPAGDILDNRRSPSGIVQSDTQTMHCVRYTVREIDIQIRRPQKATEVIAGDNLARIFQERHQDLKGVVL